MGFVIVVLLGAVAGSAGTLAMDSLWYTRYRLRGGEPGFVGWEFSSTVNSFDGAPAPAQVGRLVATKLGLQLPDSSAALVNNIVHWFTGVGWGAAHALVFGRSLPWLAGPITGTVAWLTSYAALAPLGIYQPLWKYDRKTLTDDWTAHLVFGLGTALTFWLVGPR